MLEIIALHPNFRSVFRARIRHPLAVSTLFVRSFDTELKNQFKVVFDHFYYFCDSRNIIEILRSLLFSVQFFARY